MGQSSQVVIWKGRRGARKAGQKEHEKDKKKRPDGGISNDIRGSTSWKNSRKQLGMAGNTYS